MSTYHVSRLTFHCCKQWVFVDEIITLFFCTIHIRWRFSIRVRCDWIESIWKWQTIKLTIDFIDEHVLMISNVPICIFINCTFKRYEWFFSIDKLFFTIPHAAYDSRRKNALTIVPSVQRQVFEHANFVTIISKAVSSSRNIPTEVVWFDCICVCLLRTHNAWLIEYQ